MIALSISLKALLQELSATSPCCRLVNRSLERATAGRRTRLLTTSPIGDYFTFRESEGLITYCPAGRAQEFNADGSWKREGRQGIKPAKWLRSILAPRLAKRIPDHIFSDFATKFRASEESGKIKFEYVSFEKAYKEENYKEGIITSCMWNEPVGDFYGCYPCKVLIAKDAKKYRGRAIIWDTVANLDSPLMDRVYADSPEVSEAFFRHAAENGWTRKSAQNNGCFTKYTLPNGEEVRKGGDSLHVSPTSSLRHVTFWPYLDTFRAMNEDGEIFNSDSEDGAAFILNDTSGDREEVNQHEGEVQCADGEWRDEDDCVCVNGDYYAANDDDIVYCHRSEEYIMRSDAYEVDMGGRIGTVYIHEDYVNRA